MKGFETGTHYLRKVALENKLIEESDNDDTLVQRLVKLIKVAAEPQAEAKVEEAPPNPEDGSGPKLPVFM